MNQINLKTTAPGSGFIGRHVSWTLTLCLSLILAFLITLALVSNRPDTSAFSANKSFNLTSTNYTNISITLYDENMVENNDFSTSVSSSGNVSTLETNVRVQTEATYGYTLSIHTPIDSMTGQGNSANTLSPTTGSIDNPLAFSASNCSAWGFATPSESGNYSQAFDSSYSIITNVGMATVSSNFAAVPTVETPIHEVDNTTISNIDETRPYYFAFCADGTTVPDTYSSTVTWTAISIDSPPLPPATTRPIANGEYIQTLNTTVGGLIITCPYTRTWVVDARDNRTYWIRKIPNTGANGTDLCWMETNLAYAGGGTNTYGDALSLTQTTSGGMGNTTANYVVSIPPTGAPVFTTNPTPPTTGSGAATGANGAQYGYHYNWCAAMGGPVANPNACNTTSTSGQNVNASVCPAGWRLPTAGANGSTAQSNNTNEFWNLNQVVNSGATSSDVGLRNNWLGVYASNWIPAGGFSQVGVNAYYWSSTINSGNDARVLRIFNAGTDVNPTHASFRDNGMAIRCVAEEPPAQNGDFIQEIGLSKSCPLTRTWVVDARDNKTYWVRKIPGSGANGTDLCWMETNLAYAGGGTNTYGDTKTLTTTATGTIMENTTARVNVSATGGQAASVAPNPPSTTSGAGGQYGFHYNWCGAMGGTGVNPNACNMTETNQANINDNASVCPAGWRLPASGDGTVSTNPTNELYLLNLTVNSGATNTDVGLRNNWLGVYAGYVDGNGNFVVGTSGSSWSSTINGTATAYRLGFAAANVVPSASTIKNSGFSIRCVR